MPPDFPPPPTDLADNPGLVKYLEILQNFFYENYTGDSSPLGDISDNSSSKSSEHEFEVPSENESELDSLVLSKHTSLSPYTHDRVHYGIVPVPDADTFYDADFVQSRLKQSSPARRGSTLIPYALA